MARQFGATFHLLHVVEAPFVTGPFSSEMYIPETSGIQDERIEEVKLRLARRLLPSDKATSRPRASAVAQVGGARANA